MNVILASGSIYSQLVFLCKNTNTQVVVDLRPQRYFKNCALVPTATAQHATRLVHIISKERYRVCASRRFQEGISTDDSTKRRARRMTRLQIVKRLLLKLLAHPMRNTNSCEIRQQCDKVFKGSLAAWAPSRRVTEDVRHAVQARCEIAKTPFTFHIAAACIL
jgi:hypothetical protein